jgi:hypothetical protein
MEMKMKPNRMPFPHISDHRSMGDSPKLTKKNYIEAVNEAIGLLPERLRACIRPKGGADEVHVLVAGPGGEENLLLVIRPDRATMTYPGNGPKDPCGSGPRLEVLKDGKQCGVYELNRQSTTMSKLRTNVRRCLVVMLSEVGVIEYEPDGDDGAPAMHYRYVGTTERAV